MEGKQNTSGIVFIAWFLVIDILKVQIFLKWFDFNASWESGWDNEFFGNEIFLAFKRFERWLKRNHKESDEVSN